MSESTPAATTPATATTATDTPEGTKTYVLRCHCSEIKMELADLAPITSATSCNCSLCNERGVLIVFVPKEKFGEAAHSASLRTYQWNKKILEWKFCQLCGSTLFAMGPGPVWGINARCVEGLDCDGLVRKPYDGKSM